MAISQVITFGGSPDQLVWKYPDENITTTSKLIVDADHEALLVVNGDAADLFGAGERTLSLPNIPLVNKITTIPTGGVNPFPWLFSVWFSWCITCLCSCSCIR